MLIYYTTCNYYLVFCIFLYLSFFAYFAYQALNEEPITKWNKIYLYSKHKFICIGIWGVGYSFSMLITWIIGDGELLNGINSIPVAIGIIIDLYFTYCVYSCYGLGVKHHFTIAPQIGIDQEQSFTVRKAEPSEICDNISAINFVEVVAFPESKFMNYELEENKIKIYQDFTVVKVDSR